MLADTLLLVRPAAFGFNVETAASNGFQPSLLPVETNLQTTVLAEFETVVALLNAAGIQLLILNDSPEPAKPDAIFPNNWFSTHPEGKLFLYPMATANRRTEVRTDWIDQLAMLGKTAIKEIIDLREETPTGDYLEGTGSLILDPAHRQIFMNRSLRSDAATAAKVAAKLGYSLWVFDAFGSDDQPVYHTNVLLAIAPDLIIGCLDTIPEGAEKQAAVQALQAGNRPVLTISRTQMDHFAGNVLFVQNKTGEKFGIISQGGWDSLNETQQMLFRQYYQPLCFHIPTIERIGGGSARCMVAELY